MVLAATGALSSRASVLAYNEYVDSTTRLPSLGYAAASLIEFGEYVTLQPGTDRELTSIRIGMMSWTTAANGAPYNQVVTLNLYQVDFSSGNAEPGALISSMPVSFTIPEDVTPTNNGTRFNLDYDFTLGAPVIVPDDLIFSIAFTPIAPTSVSLNVAVYPTTGGSAVTPTVGSDPEPNASYFSPTSGGGLQRGTPFPYSIAAQISVVQTTAVPEPSPAALFAGGLLVGVLMYRGRRLAGREA